LARSIVVAKKILFYEDTDTMDDQVELIDFITAKSTTGQS
jgi:hypothetical protein